MTEETAIVWASGHVEFVTEVPGHGGAFAFAKGPRRALRSFVKPKLRLSYDGETLLMPGLPEAEDQDQAYIAFTKFVGWIKGLKLPRSVRVL